MILLKPRDQEISEFYVVQKRRTTDYLRSKIVKESVGRAETRGKNEITHTY